MSAVVGVDPSIASTGVFGITEHSQLFKRVQSKPADQTLAERLGRMRAQAIETVRAVSASVAPLEPVLIVIEGPAFGSNNAQTHALAGFWWLLVHGLAKLAPIAVVQPPTLKKFATGNGRAGKDEMLAAAIEAFPGLGIKNNDVADAAALAGMGALRVGISFGGGFASSGRASVQAVHWPELRGESK